MFAPGTAVSIGDCRDPCMRCPDGQTAPRRDGHRRGRQRGGKAIDPRRAVPRNVVLAAFPSRMDGRAPRATVLVPTAMGGDRPANVWRPPRRIFRPPAARSPPLSPSSCPSRADCSCSPPSRRTKRKSSRRASARSPLLLNKRFVGLKSQALFRLGKATKSQPLRKKGPANTNSPSPKGPAFANTRPQKRSGKRQGWEQAFTHAAGWCWLKSQTLKSGNVKCSRSTLPTAAARAAS